MSDMRVSTKTPLKAPAMPEPGESLQRRLDDLIEEKVFFWVVFPICFFGFAFLLWLQQVMGQQPKPLVYLGVGVAMIPVAAWRIIKAKRETAGMRLGLQGERLVGQFLDEYRPDGYRVFHDIEQHDHDGTEFNVDHVMIGPGGIFSIETKTRSKPAIGDPIIRYDGERLSVDDGPWDVEPLRQARANASRVRDILQESTGRKDIVVRPVVLYPGWYVEGTQAGREVWVLNPKAFLKFVAKADAKLSPEDVALYASRLKGHVHQQRRS